MKTTSPRRQRKRLYQDPLHKRYKRFSAALTPKLKSSHNTNSIPLRTGDTVQVMRGDRKGLEGKVSQIDRKNYRIYVEGINREKIDGTSIPIPIHPSKVMITNLNLDDKWRREILKRKTINEKTQNEAKKPKKTSKPKKAVKIEGKKKT